MMAMHAAVLPAQDLAGLRKELAPRYGARVVDEGDRRILVVRVPRAEPDPVLDVEACIDVLDPADVEDITHCILVGDARASQVYARPIQDLMAERIAFDKAQAKEWRERFPGKLAFQLYRAPSDPRRRWRLAVRLPMESVKELRETHLEDLADRIGTQLESPRFQELAAVYLIAATDDVRMEADHFVQELVKVHKDDERRRSIEQELIQKREADMRRREAERNLLIGELQQRFTARAPLRAMDQARAPLRHRESSGTPVASEGDIVAKPLSRAERLLESMASEGETPLVEAEDAIETKPRADDVAAHGGKGRGARGALAQGERGITPLPGDIPTTFHDIPAAVAADRRKADSLQARVDALTRRAQEIRPGEDLEEGVARFLQHAGFDVIVRPETPYAIDLAAERPEGEPQRIVFRIVTRLDDAVAQELLRTARELDVDHVFCVAEQADDVARRRLVATKVTWCRPHELRSLRL